MRRKAKRRGRPRGVSENTAFGRWINKEKKTIAEIMTLLDCSASTVYGLANGSLRPTRAMGWTIEEITDGQVPLTRKAWGAQ